MRNAAVLSLLLLLGCRAGSARPAAPPPETDVKPGINAPFLGPDVQVQHFVDVFESESREVAVRRDAIVAALGLRPGEDVADVGAGTGLFLAPLAAAVGPQGKLYEVDLSPAFVAHLRERVQKEGVHNVEVVQCTERSAELPPASVDVIFVCDTYHHFEYPQSTLASLHSALRPGGRLVIVDFEREPGVSRDWVLQHVRAGKADVRAEVEAAGFAFEDEPDVGLHENYVLRFRRS